MPKQKYITSGIDIQIMPLVMFVPSRRHTAPREALKPNRSLTTKTAEPAGIAGHHPRRALVRSGVPQ